MSTRKNRKRGRGNAIRRTDIGAGLLDLPRQVMNAPNDATIARVVELTGRWKKLESWGAMERLPWTKETQKDITAFLDKARTKGEIDPSLISSITVDVKRLELEAQEWAKKNGSAPYTPQDSKTTHDIEKATSGLAAAADVSELAKDVTKEAKEVVKDLAKGATEAITVGASAIPWWVWAVGGAAVLGVAAHAVSNAATAANVVFAGGQNAPR